MMSDFNIRPLGDKLIVDVDEEETTSGGIIIAHSKNDGLATGTVLAIGKGTYDKKGKFIETEVQPGTRIVFNLGSGEIIKHDDNEYVTIHENEILGTIT